jgi:hypothetical protein
MHPVILQKLVEDRTKARLSAASEARQARWTKQQGALASGVFHGRLETPGQERGRRYRPWHLRGLEGSTRMWCVLVRLSRIGHTARASAPCS